MKLVPVKFTVSVEVERVENNREVVNEIKLYFRCRFRLRCRRR